MFDLKYSNQAARFLKNVDKVLIRRLLQKIEILQEQPVVHDSKVVEGSNEKLFRVRVGAYRILYEVDYENNIVGIIRIDRRSRVY